MLSSFLQKLLFIKQFDIDKGKINILGDRYIMLNASSIASLQEIDKTEIYEASKKSSKSDMKKLVAHAQVYKNVKNEELKNIANLSKRIGKNDEGIIRTLEIVFEIYGLGDLKIINLDNDKKTADLRVEDSTLAQVNRAKKPACAITAGILAGIFSYILGKDVDCLELKCKACGNSLCEFKVS